MSCNIETRIESESIRDAIISGKARELIEEMIKEFYLMLDRKKKDKNGKSIDIYIPHEYEDECIDEMIKFYEEFLETNNQRLLCIDFYKIISWYAFLISEKMYKIQKSNGSKNWISIIKYAVWIMLYRIERTKNITIPEEYQAQIIAMVVREIQGTSNFGIGKNGFYMLMLMLAEAEYIDVKADN
ncbi:MAG: hypothetical protein K2N12_07645 [Helicobacter sp.]|nr:hypothetical protein [Helicobacter sp.]